MKYGLLILLLLILFISVLYIKKHISNFVCACEKEDFTPAGGGTLPKFSKFDDFVEKFLKKNLVDIRPMLWFKREDLKKVDATKNAAMINTISETIILIDGIIPASAYVQTSSPPPTSVQNDVSSLPDTSAGAQWDSLIDKVIDEARTSQFEISDGHWDCRTNARMEHCDHPAHKNKKFQSYCKGTCESWRKRADGVCKGASVGGNLSDSVCATRDWGNCHKVENATAKYGATRDENITRPDCRWVDRRPSAPPTSGSVEGFANIEYFTTAEENAEENTEYKTLIEIFKRLYIIEPNQGGSELKKITTADISDEEYCKFWEFSYAIGLEEGKGPDYEKCFINKTKTKTEDKTFYDGLTSSFNFSDKNFKNTTLTKPSTGNTPTPDQKTEAVPTKDTIKSSKKSCSKSDSIKSISKKQQDLDMDKYILKTEMSPPPDMSEYVKKSDLNNFKIDKSKYILKSRIPAPSRLPDPNKYILKTQLKPPTINKNPIYK